MLHARNDGTAMNGNRHAAVRAAPALLPLALLFVPKCPLCVLPLFAAFGSLLPPAPVLDAIVGLTAFVWLILLARARPSAGAIVAGLAGALVLFGSRWLDLPVAGWAGALVMAAVAMRVRARKVLRSATSAAACGPESCP
jgi:hypothetical protein